MEPDIEPFASGSALLSMLKPMRTLASFFAVRVMAALFDFARTMVIRAHPLAFTIQYHRIVFGSGWTSGTQELKGHVSYISTLPTQWIDLNGVI